MTALEWIDTIALIVAIVLSLTLYTIALRKTMKEGFTGRWGSILVLAGGALFIIYLAYHTYEIAPADWAQILLMLGLVCVTGLYAFSAFRQANASVKMAEEMKEQRLAMYKPHIVLEDYGGVRGKYFMKEIGVGIGNEGQGTAINVELYIAHPFFKFKGFRCPHPISAGQDAFTHDFPVIEPSVEDDPGVLIDPVALVIANYEDVSGNPWHSVLELHWHATNKDITPGRTQVAVKGHFHSGENIND